MEAKINTRINKPVAYIKVQTTGFKPSENRIVELAITRIDVDGKITQGVRQFNPMIAIPADATAIHGITDADVADKPEFKTVAAGLYKFINDCDIVGFGVSFDLSFLIEEFGRAGFNFTTYNRDVVDTMRIWHKLEPRDFLSAYERFTGKNLEEEFKLTSKSQTEMSVEILNGLTKEFTGQDYEGEKIENNLKSISLMFKDNKESIDLEEFLLKTEAGVVFAVGKHKGELVTSVLASDISYIQWILEGANNLSYETKTIIRTLKERADEKAKETKTQATT